MKPSLALFVSVVTLFGLLAFNVGKVQASSGDVVSNPASFLVVPDKGTMLPADYVPNPLVTPDVPFSNDTETMQATAADALEKMFSAAAQDGINFYAVSGYRSYSYQESLYQSYVDEYGEGYASQISAQAGHSEHQTGLTMDITSPEVNYQLSEAFGDSNGGQWVEDHAHEYGFIIRYPEGKEHITGYSYEPWHLRYVGTDVATNIANQSVTLDEYFSHDGTARIHTVQSGDTLSQIAYDYDGVTLDDLYELNPGIDPYALQIGMEITISSGGSNGGNDGSAPDSDETYVVHAGDTFWEIANQYDNVTVNQLMAANPGIEPTALQINQLLTIPTSNGDSGGSSDNETYTVEAGDTMWAIARNYDGVTVSDIQDANPSIIPTLMSIGTELNIPS